MSTLDVRIRNATVMLPSGPAHCTVGIAGGKLLLDPPDTLAAEREIDATGLTLMPGVIDAHLHFRDPGFPHKEDLFTGPLAAVTGGVTSFFEMPNTSPATISQARLAEKLAIASHKSLANYGFYLGATSDAAGAPGNLPDLATLRRSPGIKIFIGSSTGDLLVDDQAALERIFAETSAPICAHCEDEATILANREAIGAITSVADHSRIRDVRAAVRSTWRTLELTLRSRHRFHLLHVSTAAEAVLLARFFLTGTLVSREVAETLANTPASEHLRELEAIPFGGALAFARDPATAADDPRHLLSAEACPHHFLLSTDDYERLGTLVQMNPPVKSADDARAIWAGLKAGALQMGATDHAPHTPKEKAATYPASPSGMPAVAHLLGLFTERALAEGLPFHEVVRWLCDRPARIWGIAGKGRIEEGFDADLVLLDPEAPHRLSEGFRYHCGTNPWEGMPMRGAIEAVFVNGNQVSDGRPAEIADALPLPRGREVTFLEPRPSPWAPGSET
jgi:dihydroorotase